jgi:hypothetical protein
VPNHWTYDVFSPDDDLSQGDIIARTPAVLDILRNIHNYFCHTKYLCFIVLTQSCDLVVRGGACKARQIGLGVVRALEEVLPDIFAELCGTAAAGVYRQDARIAAQQLLERVINQNEQAHGLFYLHPDADVEIAVPAVAMLRVSIALRSREHYQALKEARRGRLATEFRNKLGWLAGNLFSRIDTSDWAEKEGGKAASERLITGLLDGGAGEPNVWVPDAWLRAATANRIDISAIPRGQVRATLEAAAPPPPLDTALGRVRLRAEQMLKELNDAQQARLIELVKADDVYPLLAAQVAFSVARRVLGPAGDQLVAILDQLPANPRSRESLAAQVTQAITRLKAMKGLKEVAPLLDLLRGTPLFDATAVNSVCEIVEKALGAAFAEQKAALVEGLRAEKMSGPVIARLHGLAREAVEEVLVEKLARRLENDGQFKGALKRG